MLGDELVLGGLPLSNLTALADTLAAGLRPLGVFITTNEGFRWGTPCNATMPCTALPLARAAAASGEGAGARGGRREDAGTPTTTTSMSLGGMARPGDTKNTGSARWRRERPDQSNTGLVVTW